MTLQAPASAFAQGEVLETVEVAIDAERPVGRSSPLIYGQGLEHIYRAVVGGLSGQLITSPSFEEQDLGYYPGFDRISGEWEVLSTDWMLKSEECELRGHWTGWRNPECQALIGPEIEGDFEFSFEARKNLPGLHGFIFAFHTQDDYNQVRWHLGNWGGERDNIEIVRDGESELVEGTENDIEIEIGQWHKIEIISEGGRVRCLVDGERLHRVVNSPWKSGRLAVGSYRSQVSFRNFDLKTGKRPKGLKKLWTRRERWKPELKKSKQETAAAWRIIAESDSRVDYVLDDKSPLNSSKSQHIVSDGGVAGIMQTGIPLVAGEEYEFTLWAKGKTGELLARIQNEDKTFMTRFGAFNSPEWNKFSFKFLATRTVANATLEIRTHFPCDIYIDQVTIYPANSIFRSTIYEPASAILPTFIRWPGGKFSERYHWRDGVGPLSLRPSVVNGVWGGVDPNNFGTAEYVRLCRETGAEPLIVLNVGGHAPDEYRPDYISEALDWIEYCNGGENTPMGALRAQHGYLEPFDVKYWEIGNDAWAMGEDRYIESLREFSDAIRAHHPDLKLLACGSGGYDQDWNEKLLEEAARCFDYLSVHHYCEAQDLSGIVADAISWPQFLDETSVLIQAGDNPDIKIAVTEWNQQSTTWGGGLYAGILLNELEKRSDMVEMAAPSLWIRHVAAPNRDNALINHDGASAFIAPNYEVIKLYREHPAQERLYFEVASSSGGGSPLNLYAARNREDNVVVLRAVNPTENAVTLHLSLKGSPPIAPLISYSIGARSTEVRNTFATPQSIRADLLHARPVPDVSTGEPTNDTAGYLLPPLSVSVIQLQLQ